MKHKSIGIVIILLLLLLSACGKDKYEPFTPLSKVTVSPEREAAVQAALNGGPSLSNSRPQPPFRMQERKTCLHLTKTASSQR